MREKIIALIWAWVSSYDPNGNDTNDSLREEDLYGKPDSPITEIGIEANEDEPHLLGFWYCNLRPTLTDWLDLSDLMAESSERRPMYSGVYTDGAKGVVQVYFNKTSHD